MVLQHQRLNSAWTICSGTL